MARSSLSRRLIPRWRMAKRIAARRPLALGSLDRLGHKVDASYPPDIGDSEFHAESVQPRHWPSDFS